MKKNRVHSVFFSFTVFFLLLLSTDSASDWMFSFNQMANKSRTCIKQMYFFSLYFLHQKKLLVLQLFLCKYAISLKSHKFSSYPLDVFWFVRSIEHSLHAVFLFIFHRKIPTIRTVLNWKKNCMFLHSIAISVFGCDCNTSWGVGKVLRLLFFHSFWMWCRTFWPVMNSKSTLNLLQQLQRSHQ